MINEVLIWVGSFLLVLLTYIYIKSADAFKYFKSLGIPGPEPVMLFGNMWRSWDKYHCEEERLRVMEYGKVFGLYEGFEPVLVVADPDILKNILVKDFHNFMNKRNPLKGCTENSCATKFLFVLEDDQWRHARKALSPVFTGTRLNQMSEFMAKCSTTLLKNIRQRRDEHQQIISRSLFESYALDVIASCTLGEDLDSLNNEEDPLIQGAKYLFHNFTSGNGNLDFIRTLSVFSDTAAFLVSYFPGNQFRNILNSFEEYIKKQIEKREGKPSPRGDFLDLLLEELLAAKKEQEEWVKVGKDTESRDTDSTSSREAEFITEDLVVAQCIVFCLVGYQTAALTLIWATYHLANNPKVQQRAYEEIKRNLKKHGSLSFDMINECSYLDMIVYETLRITPPLSRIERRCKNTCQYGNLTIEEGMIVQIPIYAIHHMDEYYPHPGTFRPERFTAEEKERRNPYSYLPFGKGSRDCLGRRFGILETKVALVYLLNKLEFKIGPDTVVPPYIYKGDWYLRPKNLKIAAVERSGK